MLDGETSTGSIARRGTQVESSSTFSKENEERARPLEKVPKNLDTEVFERVSKWACVNGYAGNHPGEFPQPFGEQRQEVDVGEDLPTKITVVSIT